MANRIDYTGEKIAAAWSVLVEIMSILAEYRDCFVLIGGWVPSLAFSTRGQQHTGSFDVDLAVDTGRICTDNYSTIKDLLRAKGYQQGEQPGVFYRKLTRAGTETRVQIDLLSGVSQETVNDLMAAEVQKAHGCDLAFDDPRVITISGELPEGGESTVTVQVASIVSFLAMKALAFNERLKAKDAYDIHYCLSTYPGGLDALVEQFLSHMHRDLVKEGLLRLHKRFSSESAAGPRCVAEFEAVLDPEERDRLRRDAFERVNYLLRELRMT
ncbi:nucleotidyl transferase AbiEii/AbiGii toxin family protein [Candidatus Poribacteria bacterium]|nr:nucleotidyl transferase AbiEii/AbiGii toxin family protein [Candidatus Poribacteria bacterium]